MLIHFHLRSHKGSRIHYTKLCLFLGSKGIHRNNMRGLSLSLGNIQGNKGLDSPKAKRDRPGALSASETGTSGCGRSTSTWLSGQGSAGIASWPCRGHGGASSRQKSLSGRRQHIHPKKAYRHIKQTTISYHKRPQTEQVTLGKVLVDKPRRDAQARVIASTGVCKLWVRWTGFADSWNRANGIAADWKKRRD